MSSLRQELGSVILAWVSVVAVVLGVSSLILTPAFITKPNTEERNNGKEVTLTPGDRVLVPATNVGSEVRVAHLNDDGSVTLLVREMEIGR